MNDFPKVSKSAARVVTGRKAMASIFRSILVAGALATAALAGSFQAAEASLGTDPTVRSENQGAMVLFQSSFDGDVIAYHQSHRSHYSHSSHRSHYSHYSSRY